MSTAARITDLLNRKAFTINELAVELNISRNSVHQQITRLEAAGSIEKLDRRTPAGAGKPAHQYRTVAGNEDLNSKAFKPVLNSLIQTISADLPEKKRIQVLENAGHALAQAAGLKPSGDSEADLEKSLEVVNSLGAMAELERQGEKSHISCYSCPVASLVHKEPLTCRLVAAFFEEASGKKVTVNCRKDETVVCGFTVAD